MSGNRHALCFVYRQKMGSIDLDLQSHCGFEWINFWKFELVCALTRLWFELGSAFLQDMCILGPTWSVLTDVYVHALNRCPHSQHGLKFSSLLSWPNGDLSYHIKDCEYRPCPPSTWSPWLGSAFVGRPLIMCRFRPASWPQQCEAIWQPSLLINGRIPTYWHQ